ncbi:MAG TPA: NAAT family transporter [Nitrospirales bacterium]|jgi:multiple antibiotic resistance protein|nr:NAAT family transporter [Nitrospirales bacterium]
MDSLFAFFLTAFVSIFVTLDPIGNVPIFLTITPHNSETERAAMVTRAVLVVFGVLVLFALCGNLIFRLFGVTIEAFRIVAGLLLLKIAFDMMEAKPARVRHTPEEDAEGAQRHDVAIIPLAIPLLSGPGSISNVIALTGQATKSPKVLTTFSLLLLAIALNALIAFILLRSATVITRLLKESGMRILTRVMGLILAAIAVQFVLTGIKEAFHVPA